LRISRFKRSVLDYFASFTLFLRFSLLYCNKRTSEAKSHLVQAIYARFVVKSGGSAGDRQSVSLVLEFWEDEIERHTVEDWGDSGEDRNAWRALKVWFDLITTEEPFHKK
jgi:hypothetical protein